MTLSGKGNVIKRKKIKAKNISEKWKRKRTEEKKGVRKKCEKNKIFTTLQINYSKTLNMRSDKIKR